MEGSRCRQVKQGAIEQSVGLYDEYAIASGGECHRREPNSGYSVEPDAVRPAAVVQLGKQAAATATPTTLHFRQRGAGQAGRLGYITPFDFVLALLGSCFHGRLTYELTNCVLIV